MTYPAPPSPPPCGHPPAADLDTVTARAWAARLRAELVPAGVADSTSRSAIDSALIRVLGALDGLLGRHRDDEGRVVEARSLSTAGIRALADAVRTAPIVWRARFSGDFAAIEAWGAAMTLQATGRVPAISVFVRGRSGVHVGPGLRLVEPGQYIEAAIGDGTVEFRPATR